MICRVFDGLFDPMYIHQIDALVKQIPTSLNNVANRKTWPYQTQGTHRLMGRTLFDRKGLNNITRVHEECGTFIEIFEMLEERLNTNFYLSQISLNVQHCGCDGTTHTDSPDSNDITLLMMTNADWKSEWGGQFQLTTPDGMEVIEEHEYVPGRIIVVPSNHPHRGLGPVQPYVYRTSIVWRVTPLDYYLKNNFKESVISRGYCGKYE